MKSNEEARGRKDVSTETKNLVTQNRKDEMLDTEESMHVLTNLNESNVNRSYDVIGIGGKEASNMINHNEKIGDVKRELRDESSSTTTTTAATAVTKINRRKYTRTR